MLARYTYKKNFNTYQIFLPDVDGLINGSPVRFMGIQIGYVNQVDIVGEDVYVKFIITEKKFNLPHGAIATVEFSGLGGSKSLELYPPKDKKNLSSDKTIVAQSPKRIHDSLGVLNDMFDKVVGITYNVSHFMDEVGIINSKNQHKNDNPEMSAKTTLNNYNKWLDAAQEKCIKFKQTLDKKNNGDKR